MGNFKFLQAKNFVLARKLHLYTLQPPLHKRPTSSGASNFLDKSRLKGALTLHRIPKKQFRGIFSDLSSARSGFWLSNTKASIVDDQLCSSYLLKYGIRIDLCTKECSTKDTKWGEKKQPGRGHSASFSLDSTATLH